MFRGIVSLFRLKFSLPSIVPGLVAFTIARYHYGVFFTMDFLIAMLVVFLVTSAGLIINQYHDYELDVLSNRTDLPLVKGEVSLKTAKLLGYSLFIPAVLLAELISLRAVWITLVASFFAIAYSAPPLRFKARPFIDSFTNGLTYGPLVMALIFESLRLPVRWAVVYSLPFFVFLSAGHMLLAVPTIEKDLSSGARTSAALLGQERAIKVGTLLFIISSIMAVAYCLLGYYPKASLTFLPFMTYSILQLWKWLRGGDWKEAFRRMEVAFVFGALAFLIPFFL
ncbi:UbiA family prenyltransferase [Thermococcus aggregans]|uniref:UbiA family prenyltransferase n=1 Tax=Thermococcus aggregans TaxID=110163 RepID=A0A9E7SQ61_THEAG|nr:UbiA family prenyltransferase [Thermococcus aggregans]USS41352.1 UbiA family prenyltransferase [Thermococcus aggregans]